jgi:type II secretory pathway component PulF
MHVLITHIKLAADTGMSMARTLDICSDAPELSPVSRALKGAAADIERGFSFSRALKGNLGHCTGPLFTGLIQVWEETRASSVLDTLDATYETTWNFFSRLRVQLLFPALGIALLALVQIWLNPPLRPFLLLFPLLPFLWKLAVPLNLRIVFFMELWSHVPGVAGSYRKLVGAMFMRCLAAILGAGCNMNQARRMLLTAFPHKFLAGDLASAFSVMESGGSFGMAFAPVTFLTASEKMSIGVGEESGALDSVLARMSRSAIDEVERQMQVTLRLSAQFLSLAGSALTGLALYSLISGSKDSIISMVGG